MLPTLRQPHTPGGYYSIKKSPPHVHGSPTGCLQRGKARSLASTSHRHARAGDQARMTGSCVEGGASLQLVQCQGRGFAHRRRLAEREKGCRPCHGSPSGEFDKEERGGTPSRSGDCILPPRQSRRTLGWEASLRNTCPDQVASPLGRPPRLQRDTGGAVGHTWIVTPEQKA